MIFFKVIKGMTIPYLHQNDRHLKYQSHIKNQLANQKLKKYQIQQRGII